MKPIQIYLEEEEVRRLKQEALDKGITLSALVRLYLLVKQGLADSSEDKPMPEKISSLPKKYCEHGQLKGECLVKGCRYGHKN